VMRLEFYKPIKEITMNLLGAWNLLRKEITIDALKDDNVVVTNADGDEWETNIRCEAIAMIEAFLQHHHESGVNERWEKTKGWKYLHYIQSHDDKRIHCDLKKKLHNYGWEKTLNIPNIVGKIEEGVIYDNNS